MFSVLLRGVITQKVKDMSVANLLPSKSNRKQVLQQSNYNFDVSPEKDDGRKFLLLRSKEDVSQETENQFSPKKGTIKSEAKKLRTIRFDLSSLKSGAIQRTNPSLKIQSEFSSDESTGDEELKKRRKIRPVVPNYVTNSDVGPCRKPRQSRQDPALISSQNSSRSTAKSQPLSIARRNARERNRVKQVNEGFATLRSRIPDYISEAYNEEKGRKSAKKLSKVETLRMAVDYIRHLEDLLDLRSAEVEEGWAKDMKSMEIRPWETPNSSGDYPSPEESKFHPSPPGPIYDQPFECQDRIFYDYDLGFLGRKEIFFSDPKRPEDMFGLSQNENEEDFKYYESFERLKREAVEEEGDDSLEEEEEAQDEEEVEKNQDSENLDLASKKEKKETEVTSKSKDGMKKNSSKKTVLPSIMESFSKGIAAFY